MNTGKSSARDPQLGIIVTRPTTSHRVRAFERAGQQSFPALHDTSGRSRDAAVMPRLKQGHARPAREVCSQRTAHVHTMNEACIGIRIHNAVATFPRRRTPRRAALMFAGRSNTSNAINPHAAPYRVPGASRPTAPMASATPVKETSRSGRGSAGGTIAIRSFLMGPKCDVAVNKNIVASAHRALTIHVPNISKPARPIARKIRHEANNTNNTCIGQTRSVASTSGRS